MRMTNITCSKEPVFEINLFVFTETVEYLGQDCFAREIHGSSGFI